MKTSIQTTTQISVPEQAFRGDEPLVAVERGGYVGSLHRGIVVVADTTGTSVLSIGDGSQAVFLRSAAKPFQAVPAILSGGVDRYHITEQELAVICASHSAEQRHMDAVLSVLDKIGVGEDALRCGVHPPIDEETAKRRIREGVEPSPACNNCSGAHSGMLVACKAMGWPIDTYGKPDHPLQRMTRQILASFAAVAVESVQYGVDNCAVPAFRLPIGHAAQAFARMSSGDGVEAHLADASRRIVRAMTAYPEMVGGRERFDSDLMRAAGGTIVAKGGAEGFQGVGIVPQHLGVAIKVTDGNGRAIPPVAMRLLDHLGALNAQQIDALWRYAEPRQYDMQDELVGRLIPVFQPGGSA